MQDAVRRRSVLPQAGHVNNSRPLTTQRVVTPAEHSLNFPQRYLYDEYILRNIGRPIVGQFWIVCACPPEVVRCIRMLRFEA